MLDETESKYSEFALYVLGNKIVLFDLKTLEIVCTKKVMQDSIMVLK